MDDLLGRARAALKDTARRFRQLQEGEPERPLQHKRMVELGLTIGVIGEFKRGANLGCRLNIVRNGMITNICDVNARSNPHFVWLQELNYYDWVINEDSLVVRRMPALPMDAMISLIPGPAQSFSGLVAANQTCSICYESMHPDTTIIRLPCGHHFDSECILAWFVRSKSCPMCRMDVEDNVPRINFRRGLLFPHFFDHEW